MGYFRHHVFFCCNQREEGECCCNNLGATDAQIFAKDRIAELNLRGKGNIRINKTGCMGRCDQGPVIVVYPEGVWYRYADIKDVEEIIQEHLIQGRVVDRLKI